MCESIQVDLQHSVRAQLLHRLRLPRVTLGQRRRELLRFFARELFLQYIGAQAL
jgi:hypothetical protein